MKIKDIISKLKVIDAIERNIVYDDKLIVITYSVVFYKIEVRICIDNDYFFMTLSVNNQNELVLDLTEDRKFIDIIGRDAYKQIINTIMAEEI